MSRTIVFDVNETLLDLGVLDELFERHLGNAALRPLWFTQVINTAITATMVGAPYRHFSEVGGAALRMVAERNDVTLTEEALIEIPGRMLSLPPHPDVPAGLQRLKDAGFQTVALTNSPLAAARAQLEAGGLIDMFDRVMSVESVGVFKPDARVYQMAARELGVETSDLLMVAAHDWDIAGAMAAGCGGAFIARPGQVTNPYFDTPDFVARDIGDAAEQIIASER
ncbi:MAG: haloacid dehalogenase type II [Chloroflexi bacterium]|jgi:2-haloacid dehalogenase|nr:haloacid dehalogenase type II [Chloroflexota bacterium]MBT4073523.1 haloacid dehalogenase type II [Chloroflexota bacterium]MBT5320664.1 haloacid dehalogenase type II [Chloroflexota bacterium]MBT6681386.1 haloacid dehalogenase type II [Chloroflexota bacterium]